MFSWVVQVKKSFLSDPRATPWYQIIGYVLDVNINAVERLELSDDIGAFLRAYNDMEVKVAWGVHVPPLDSIFVVNRAIKPWDLQPLIFDSQDGRLILKIFKIKSTQPPELLGEFHEDGEVFLQLEKKQIKSFRMLNALQKDGHYDYFSRYWFLPVVQQQTMDRTHTLGVTEAGTPSASSQHLLEFRDGQVVVLNAEGNVELATSGPKVHLDAGTEGRVDGAASVVDIPQHNLRIPFKPNEWQIKDYFAQPPDPDGDDGLYD